jgi:hypothetical protein
VEVPGGVDVPGDLRDDLRLPPPLPGLFVGLRVLHRDRRLVGERLGQPDLLVAEHPAGHAPHAERPDRPAPDEQRHRQHGAIRRVPDAVEHLRSARDPAIGQEIGRGHRPALSHGEADHAGAGRIDEGAVETEVGAAGHSEHRQAPRVGRKPEERRPLGGEQHADAVHDPLPHHVGIERLGDEAAHVREALGRPLAALRLLEAARVEDGDRGVVGELQENRLVPIRERAGRAAFGVEQSLHAALATDRDDHLGDDPVGPGRLEIVLGDPIVLRVVVRAEGTPGPEDLPSGALARLDPQHGVPRVAGPGPAAERHRFGVAVPEGDHRLIAPAQFLGGVRNPLQDRIEVERGVDAPGEVGDDFRLPPPPLGLGVEPGVLQRERGLAGEGLGQADFALVVEASLPGGDREGADHPVLGDQRDGQHRPVRRLGDALADFWRVGNARIGHAIGGEDGSAFAHGQAADARPRREHEAPVERGDRVAGDGHRHEVARLRVQTVDDGIPAAEQRPHAVGDLLRDEVEVQGFGEESADLREGLGRPGFVCQDRHGAPRVTGTTHASPPACRGSQSMQRSSRKRSASG